jgi:hypothetical protein
VNLQEMRDYIRTQLDMDEEELPNPMLDSYIDEAYMRTISMENRWPFFETSWTLTKLGPDSVAALPASCDPAGLYSVRDTDTGLRLTQVSNEQAEDNFQQLQQSVTTPYYYTLWGSELRLWPTSSADVNLALRGYRHPSQWMVPPTGGAGAVPDCDQRLHFLLCHYAIALCYAQQEDEVLEDVYMKRWQASFVAARNAICNPRHQRPLVLNGGLPISQTGTSMIWGPPVGP